jgi:hypothetical protein
VKVLDDRAGFGIKMNFDQDWAPDEPHNAASPYAAVRPSDYRRDPAPYPQGGGPDVTQPASKDEMCFVLALHGEDLPD